MHVIEYGEILSSIQVTVVASDGGDPPRSGSMFVTIVVLDANDNSPQFDRSTYDVRISESTSVGSELLRVHAVDPDTGPNGHVTYQFSNYTASSSTATCSGSERRRERSS